MAFLPSHLSQFVSFFQLFVTLSVSLSPSRRPCPLYRCSNGHVSIVSTHGLGQSVWRTVNGCQDCGYGQHVCSFAQNILFGFRTSAYLICRGVGKTSLLQRYTQGKFDPNNTTSTTGAFFVTKKVLVDGLKVRLQLWDTAGQERFRSMVSTVSLKLLDCRTN